MRPPGLGMRSLGVALLVYVVLTVLWLAPLFRHFDSAVLYGPTDSVGAISDYWAAAQVGDTPLTFDHNPFNGAPEGYPRSQAIAVANAVQPLVFLALKPVLGYVGAWNALTVSAFFLSALGVFALLAYLGRSFAAALLGGYVFGFAPWMFSRAYAGHSGMQHIWVLPLLFLAFVALHRRRDVLTASAIGGLAAVAFYWHSYIGLMAAVMVTTFYGLELVVQRDRLRTLAHGAISFTVLVALFLPPLWLYLTDTSAVSQSVSQPLTDLQQGGAIPLDYLVPSERHPLLGGLRDIEHAGEKVLFYGWSTLMAAVVGGVLLLRRRVRGAEAADVRYVALLAAVLAVVAVIVSFPPHLHVLEVAIPTPSYAVAQVVTFWRAYARVGIVVGLAVVVLAAFAYDRLLTRRHGLVLGAAAAVVVVFELLAGPPIPTWRTDRPGPHVEWLAARTDRDIVANYPLPIERPALDLGSEENWNVVHHGHPVFALWGGNNGGTREEAIRIVASNLSDPLAAAVLAAQHVRWVVVHDDVYAEIGAQRQQLDPERYRLAATLGPKRIFEVVAEPVPDLDAVLLEQSERIAQARAFPAPDAEYARGFNEPELFEDGRRWRWLIQGGEIVVRSAEAGSYLLALEAFSNGEPRTLTLRTAHGEELARAAVLPSRQRFVLGPFYLAAPATLRLAAEPGPAPFGGGDPRSGSIFLSPFELRPAPAFFGRLNRDS